MVSSLPSGSHVLVDLPTEMRQVMGWLVLVLWPLKLLLILTDWTILGMAGMGLLLLYLLLALVTISWGNRVLCLVLAAAALAVTFVDGNLGGLADSIEGALVFMAFIPTAHFLRNVAKREPRVLYFRERFMDAPMAERPGWLLIGSNVLGSVLTAGSLAVLSPVYTARADATARRSGALAAVAGTALACVWSPFFVAMALISSFLPDVSLWQAILVGLFLSATGLALALAMVGTPTPFKTTLAALRALLRFFPLVLVAGLCVVTLRGITPLSTLEAACLALPPLCLLLILLRGRSAAETVFGLRRIARSTRREFDGIGGEISVVSFAFILALVMRESPAVGATVAALGITELPGFAILTAVACGTAVAAMLSIHPIVGTSVMLAIFSGGQAPVSDLALMGAALLGWSSAAMLAYSGLLVIMATSMFDVRRDQLIFGRNMVFALAFAAIGTLMLSILDLFLT